MKKKKQIKTSFISHGTVALNRKARFDFDLQEQIEAGIVLTGNEVKSLRLGRCSLKESYVKEKNGEIFLTGMHIPAYSVGGFQKIDEYRNRKLLLHKKEIGKFAGITNVGGKTLVPLKLYFNKRGLAKVIIAIGIGKKKHDKRETIKQRDWNRQKQRLNKLKN
ncbi:MAG: SsrA-binding protein SmpB [Alphaproteobacteria bacterium]|nr:MAG: SsrA-binding protein [Rickettsiaceae bacterium 4572_127]